VLEQRLEQLSPTAREVAAVAAVIGRGFDFDVIVQASHRDRGEVVSALDELCVRGIVHERENGTYDFGHEKIREVAYNALSLARRRLLHRRAARALESLFAHDAEASGNLARHYAAAGATEKAVDYQLAAGQRALELSAHREAIWHLEQGLDLLESGPRTADRDRIELAFRMALASAMIPQSGFAAPEVREIYDRAAKLAQQLGEKPQLVPVLYGLGQYYMLRGKWKKSQALGERALDLAEHARQPDGLLLAHALLGFVLSYMGEPAEASNHLEASLARYDQQAESPIPGTDLGVMCRCYSALMLLVRGYPRLSKAEMDDALRLAHDLSRPHSLAAALNHASGLHLLRREAAATQRYAEKCITLSTEYGFTHWNALSGILQGWALSQQGSPSEGLAQAQRGLARLAALGVDLNPYTFTLLAEIHGNAADVVQGLHAVNRAIAAQDDGLRAFASMTLRIRGDLLRLRDADLEGAETSYRQAIDVARAQGVRTFELQATLGLCRLLRKQERQAEAQKLLAKMHDWFTEGFDTPDLKAARALLAAWT
jgi:tetratricopeptide (TPR) repeat protein